MNKKQIAIRLDDICPTMNWGNFIKVIEILNKYNIKPLLGVVPFVADKKLMIDNENEKFYDIMIDLQNKGFTFALHGYDHVYRNQIGGILSINKKSEMCGESYEYQLDRIKKGKEFLVSKGLKINCYMSPSHSYDKNTLKAINNAKINFVTDGYYNKNYFYKNLTFIPCKNTYVIKKIKQINTLCLHPNTMNESEFKKFDETLNINRKYLVDYSQLMHKVKNKRCGIVENLYLLEIKLKKLLYKFFNYIKK